MCYNGSYEDGTIIVGDRYNYVINSGFISVLIIVVRMNIQVQVQVVYYISTNVTPNEKVEEFYRKLVRTLISKPRYDGIIVIGDFNSTVRLVI